MAAPVIACPSCGAKNRVPVAAKGHPVCPKCRADLPWLIDAGDSEFAAAIDTGQLVLVDLWAPWCGPCRMVAPALANLAHEFAGHMKVVKVNVDEAPKTAAHYEARSIPMLLFIRAGEVVETIVGAQPEHVMRSRIQQYV